MTKRSERATFYVVTDKGDSDYFEDLEDMEAVIEIWKTKGRKKFQIFMKVRGFNGK